MTMQATHVVLGSGCELHCLGRWCGAEVALEKKRKEKKRKDYAFRCQFNEKPSTMPGCPDEVAMLMQKGRNVTTEVPGVGLDEMLSEAGKTAGWSFSPSCPLHYTTAPWHEALHPSNCVLVHVAATLHLAAF